MMEVPNLDAASGPVGVAVGGNHPSVDAPGDLDLHVLLVREQFVEALLLAVDKQLGAGVQRPPRGVQRVALAAAVTVQVLLHPATVLIPGPPARRTMWKGSINDIAPGSSSVVAVLSPATPSIATTSMPSRQAWSRSASQSPNTFLERPSSIASSREGPVPSRTGARTIITLAYLSVPPHLLVNPTARWWSPRLACTRQGTQGRSRSR